LTETIDRVISNLDLEDFSTSKASPNNINYEKILNAFKKAFVIKGND